MAISKSNIDLALARYWRPWSLPYAPSALECAIHNSQAYNDSFYSYDNFKSVLRSAFSDYVTAITLDYRKKLDSLYCGLRPVAPVHVKGCGIINLSNFLNSDYDFRLL